jgi:hypothetical protein
MKIKRMPCLRFACLPLSMRIFLSVDSSYILFFAETMSKFGSGLFLLVQVMLLLDFVHGWNDKWVGYDEQFWQVLAFIIFSSRVLLITFDTYLFLLRVYFAFFIQS